VTLARARTRPATAMLGLGTATPDGVVDQARGLAFARARCATTDEQRRMLAALYRRTGVRSRASVLAADAETFYPPDPDGTARGPTTGRRMARYAREASPLAARAAHRALVDARLHAGALTHLVTVSCTGFFAPGLPRELGTTLGLSQSIEPVHVGFMGCHGLVDGLRVARGLAAGHAGARVLVVAVELCSLHFQYGWDPDRVVANALFADGAAAIVLGDVGDEGSRAAAAPAGRDPATAAEVAAPPARAPGAPDDGHLRARPRPGPDDPLAVACAARAGPAAPWRLRATASRVLPDSAGAMTWTIGDHGFAMTLSARVPELVATHVAGWLGPWLASHGLTLGEVGSWAVHPGGPRVLGAVADGLGLPREALAVSAAVLAEHGNMSSPTVAFVLERLRAAGAARPCVALAFGPGLVGEAALFV